MMVGLVLDRFSFVVCVGVVGVVFGLIFCRIIDCWVSNYWVMVVSVFIVMEVMIMVVMIV